MMEFVLQWSGTLDLMALWMTVWDKLGGHTPCNPAPDHSVDVSDSIVSHPGEN